MSSVPAMANLYRTVSLHVSDSGRYVSGLGCYDCKFHSHRYTGPYPNRRSNFPVRTGRYGTYRPIFGSMIPTMNGGYSKRAYVTFLVGNGDYVKGVVALAKCLRKVKSAYPLVVAVMPDVPEDHRKALRCQGCVVHEIIEPICPPESQIPIERIHSEALYSKLCVWTLEKYNKMINLDADIQVVDNIDHFFDLPDGYFYAVPDCFCENTEPLTSVLHWVLPNMPRIRSDGQLKWVHPLLCTSIMGILCSNLAVRLTKTLLKTLQITPPGIFLDQDFLNNFFKHVQTHSRGIQPGSSNFMVPSGDC